MAVGVQTAQQRPTRFTTTPSASCAQLARAQDGILYVLELPIENGETGQ